MTRPPFTYTVQCPTCDTAIAARIEDGEPVVPTGHDFCGAFTDGAIAEMEEEIAEQYREDRLNEDGPSDHHLQQFYGDGDESPRYRTDMHNSGRGHLLG